MYTSMFIIWPHVVGRMANLQTKTLSMCRNIINSFKHWSSLKNKKNLWILTKWTGLNMLYQSWLKQLHQFKRYLFCFLKTSRKKNDCSPQSIFMFVYLRQLFYTAYINNHTKYLITLTCKIITSILFFISSILFFPLRR